MIDDAANLSSPVGGGPPQDPRISFAAKIEDAKLFDDGTMALG